MGLFVYALCILAIPFILSALLVLSAPDPHDPIERRD